jgi:hypothetical protein
MNRLKFVLIPAISVITLGMIIYFGFLKKSPKELYQGMWEAQWRTLPESFQGVDGITSFEMNGTFYFTQDSVTVTAMGFPGCVFGVDTLTHTQLWSLNSKPNDGHDTLSLFTEPGISGISYQVIGKSEQRIELQLLEDIFVSLEKVP